MKKTTKNLGIDITQIKDAFNSLRPFLEAANQLQKHYRDLEWFEDPRSRKENYSEDLYSLNEIERMLDVIDKEGLKQFFDYALTPGVNPEGKIIRPLGGQIIKQGKVIGSYNNPNKVANSEEIVATTLLELSKD